MNPLRKQAGDTLVEVLIAMSIISLVLVGAYVATNRNTATLQNTAERTQGEKLVASQIEALRSNASSLTGSDKCFDRTTGSGTTSCTFSGIPGSGATYTVAIARPSQSWPSGMHCGPTSTTSYSICANWTGLGAAAVNNDNVTMYYSL